MRRLLRSPQSRLPSSPIRGTAARGIAVAGLAVLLAMGPAAAQSGEPHPQEQQKAAPANPSEPPKEAPRKVDEYAEAAQAINGPAGNPECVWLGQRIVNLMWRDDIDTAFRHIDLYDRFGCPGGHVQAAFRCLTKFADAIDPKQPDSLARSVHTCWINPGAQPPAAASPPPAAAAQPAAPATPPNK